MVRYRIKFVETKKGKIKYIFSPFIEQLNLKNSMPNREVVKISKSESLEKEIEILSKKLKELSRNGKKSEISGIKKKIDELEEELDSV